jgi:serine protease Do
VWRLYELAFGCLLARLTFHCEVSIVFHGFRQASTARHATLLESALAVAVLLAMMVWKAPAANAAAPPPCDVPAAVAHALPAVVKILAIRGVSENGEPSGIRYFVGTGIIIDRSGLLVTNQHVIQNAAVVRVTFQDKTQAPAHLVAAAALVDLALLKVDVNDPLPTLSFADSDKLKIGQPVIAVGNPIGVGTSISTGSVSAVNRDLMRTPFDRYIQTDASMNPGNSGGPLLDCNGNVVGINTALLSNNKTLGSIGVGFALPSNTVKFVAGKLREPGASPNWIGVHLQDLDARLAILFKRPTASGAVVTSVDPGSPAARATLVPGDVVTRISGSELPDSRAIQRAIASVDPGTPLTLSVWHHGQRRDISVRGVPWPNFKKLQSKVSPNAAQITKALTYGVGLHVVAITEGDRERFGLSNVQGVLVDRVDPDTQAADVGLELGDVIVQLGDQPAMSPEQVMADLTYGKPESNDLVAVLVRKRTTGSRWIGLWVGRPNLREFMNRGSVPELASGTQHAGERR